MELSTATPQAISNLNNHRHHLIINPTTNLSSKPSLPLRKIPLSLNPLQLYSPTSEETPSGANPYAAEEHGSGVSLEDVVPPENNLYNRTWTEEAGKEDANADADGQIQIFEYFSNLDLKFGEGFCECLPQQDMFLRTVSSFKIAIPSFFLHFPPHEKSDGILIYYTVHMKLDSDDTYSLLLYGGGALFALWLASNVVRAIDSIPLFPKLLEVVGLGYTIWFSSRYLIFKVLGSDDD